MLVIKSSMLAATHSQISYGVSLYMPEEFHGDYADKAVQAFDDATDDFPDLSDMLDVIHHVMNAAGHDLLRLWFEFPARLVQVDFLLAELQGHAAAGKLDALHAQYPGIKFYAALDVGDG